MKTARDYLTANTILLIGWVSSFGLMALGNLADELGLIGILLFALILFPTIIFGFLGITRFFILCRKASREDMKSLWLLLLTSLILVLPIVLKYVQGMPFKLFLLRYIR